jgi:hypothetical protein
VPPQFVVPAGQHTPLWQVPPPQLLPHVPQLLLSVCVLTQTPLQSICPGAVHVIMSGGASISASLPLPSVPASSHITCLLSPHAANDRTNGTASRKQSLRSAMMTHPTRIILEDPRNDGRAG